MATIRSVFSPGTTFNVLDPNAWIGGVVPGPNDIAQIGENADYRTVIHTGRAPYSTYASPFSGSTIVKNSGSVIFPWDGNDVTIPVSANNTNYNSEYQFPETSGSFMIYSRGSTPNVIFPIKIDYLNKSTDSAYYFYSCSIDRNYSNWIYKTGSTSYDADLDEKAYPKELSLIVRYNDYVYPLHTKFELTGSDTWHVGQIETLERCHLTFKNNSTLKLDGSSVNPNAIYNNQDSYRNEIRILDNVTVELTGSTQRTNAGIYIYNRNGILQISGSDQCPNTTLSQSANAGDSIITLANTSSIKEGNIISIDNEVEHIRYEGIKYDIFEGYNPYTYYSDARYPTGSTFRNFSTTTKGGANISISGSYKEHEVVQVISQSGNDYTIAKLFGKEGKIQQDLGLFSYEQFVQTFSGSLDIPYTGNKRVVLIDSLHKDFQAGEKLVINRSTVAEVLYADYYLSSSLFLDFTNGATTDAIHTSSYAGYTGSFIDVTTNGNYHLYYENYFRGSQYWTTAPRTGSNGVDVTSSLHIGDSTKSNFYGSNPNFYAAFVLKNTNFHEGEITVKWSRNYNLTSSCDYNAMLSVWCGLGHKHDNMIPIYNSNTSYDHTWGFINSNRYIDFDLRKDGGGSSRAYFYPLLGEQYARSLPGNKCPIFTVKGTLKKGHSQWYFNETKIADSLEVSTKKEPIKLISYRNNSILSIDVKDYYQVVLLDTEESFNYKDKVLEGARLEYNQTSGKRVRTNGAKIKNPLGYRNLFNDQVENGKEATILPAPHSQTTSVAQNGNYNSFYRWSSNYSDGGTYYEINYPDMIQSSYRKTGTGYYIIYDLQTEASMSALSFRDYNDYNYDYTERAGENIQIDVSNDLENWTTVYGPTPDPRYTTRLGQLRFYDFTSGSISGRFVKLYLNGSSRSTNNALSSVGLYNFYDESNQDMGNTIELYNADMFEVGDRIFFQEFKYPQGVRNTDNMYPAVEWDTLPGVSSGTTTDSDVCGGLTFLHTITAKSGNKITLDRKVANYPIYEGTHVYKWNQGSINFKGNYKNLASYTVDRNSTGLWTYQCMNANFDHVKKFSGLGGGQYNMMINGLSENISINAIDKDSSIGVGGWVEKNNFIVGGGYTQYAGFIPYNWTEIPDTCDLLVFNNTLLNYAYRTSPFTPKIYSYISNQTWTYNLIGPKFTTNLINTTTSTANYSTTNKIKYSHNFITNHRYINGISTWIGGKSGNEGFIDHLEAKDNYSNYTRFGYYQVDNWYGNYRNSRTGAFRNNIEDFKSYGYLSNSYNINTALYQYGTTTVIHGSQYALRNFSNNPVIKLPILTIGGGYSIPSFRIIKPQPNSYHVYKGFPNGRSAARSYYGIPFIYYAQIKILETQDIKFYTQFDYFRESYFPYLRAIYSNNDNLQGKSNLILNQPRIILAHADTKKIVDKIELSSTGSATALYNKTSTLTPGEYLYGLLYEDSQVYNKKAFEHGPIDFNIFSTSPSNVKVYFNNWDNYTMLDDIDPTPSDRDVLPNQGRFKPLRASNTLPTGTIKIRKLKL